MRPCTPSARSRWRVKVVLPAPSGPSSSTQASRSAGRAASAAAKRPQAASSGQGRVRLSRIGGWIKVLVRLRRWHSGWQRPCRSGAGPWLFLRSAWPMPTFPAPNLACWRGCRPAATARWTTWPATACAGPARPRCSRARCGSSPRAWITCRAARPRAGRRPSRPGCCGRVRRWCRCMLGAEIGPFGHRAFTDTGPVMEVELATRAGLGWRGKHTLALSREGGSMSFLGELLVTLPLPLTEPDTDHCGQCRACLDACPTQAFQGPYRLDARRCISYLTIEHEGPIEEALRPLIGNHLYGCDDCQLVCPWNKFAQPAVLADFDVREPWAAPDLLTLWRWDEPTFVQRNLGSAIRAIGWQRWRRNLAGVSGNALAAGAPNAQGLRQALTEALPQADDLVAEHITWALARG